jgi:transposase
MKRGPKVDPRIREAIVVDYLSSGSSLREMEVKYGHSYAIIGRWVKRYKDQSGTQELVRKAQEAAAAQSNQAVSQEVKDLQDQLRMANLKNELLEALLQIGKEQFGLDLRKKPGPKQS